MTAGGKPSSVDDSSTAVAHRSPRTLFNYLLFDDRFPRVPPSRDFEAMPISYTPLCKLAYYVNPAVILIIIHVKGDFYFN